MSRVSRAIYEASKKGEAIKANIRLRKNGHFSSVEGTVEDIRVSRDGFPYVVFHKNNGWQNVRLRNVLSVVRNGKTYRDS